MATTLEDSVIHWRKKLERNTDEDIILNCIRKLSKVPMTIEILQDTHIAKTIRNLSKRPDIVGEKALAVLKKWRDSFASPEQHTAKTSKTVNNISKKENINKRVSSSFSKHDVAREKSHQKELSYEHKHKHKKTTSSVSVNSSEHSKKYMNGGSVCDVNNSGSFNHLYTYEKNETSARSVDYDPNIDISEGYNPECPELYPGSSKFSKVKKVVNLGETYEPSCLKRKLIAEEETDSHKNKYKKPKLESHTHVDSVSVEIKQKREKHNYHKDKSKDHKSHSSQNKMGSSDKTKHTNDSEHKSSPESRKSKKGTVEKSSLKSKKSKTKLKLNCTEEFTSSEARFEDCLGFSDIVSVKKKKSVKSSQSVQTNKKPLSTSNKAAVTSSSQSIPSHKNSSSEEKYPEEISSKGKSLTVPKPSVKLEEVDIVSTLPQTQPNYRPLPQRSLDPSPTKKKAMTDEEAIRFTSSRREKTAVYSGRRTYHLEEVPSLHEFCTRVLIENIDAIEFMGEVPYFLLKPVLERCTPVQLFNIEGYNPYLVAETSELWEVHCKRDFRLLSRQENETWRELYLRAHDEQERRLKCVTANITASMGRSGPARQVKLAYVDSVVKPPRDVARRQAKNGTAIPVNHTMKAGPSKVTPKPVSPAISSSSSSSGPIIPKKPKLAPLMAKTLKSMKQCFRR